MIIFAFFYGMIIRRNVMVILLVCVCTYVQASDTLRIMHYNLMQYAVNVSSCITDLSHKDQCLRTIIKHVHPDIITVNEVGKELKYTKRILDSCLNIDGISCWAHGKLTSESGGNANKFSNMIFYNKEKLTMYTSYHVPNAVRDFNIYKLYVNNAGLRQGDTVFLVVIVGHLKAGVADSLKRESQVEVLMKNLGKIGKADNYIFCGDINVYSSYERAYQLLVNHPKSTIRFYDPIEKAGYWHDNPQFSTTHTQSTHDVYGDCYSAGGLDDRFDFILVSESIMKGTRQIKALPRTYRAVGQDGMRLNKSIIDNNTSLPAKMLNALSIMSDHLPVMMDLKIEEVNTSRWPAGNDLSREMKSVEVKKPMDNQLTFSLNDRQSREYKVEITSIFGQVVFVSQVQTTAGENEFTLNLPKLLPGIYCLKLTCEGAHTIRKIIKR